MVQFNLLPDVKLEYVKTQRTKHLLTLLSVVVSAAAIGILAVAIISVDVVQKKSLHDLNNDISRYSGQLKDVKDLDKILTVQNQLSTLTGLHDQKPVTSRLFGYLSQLIPQKAALNKLTLDYTTNQLTMGGTADTLDTVSTLTDTLKATKYTTDAGGKGHAFSDVVLSSFSRDDAGASFTVTCTFEPAIFNSGATVTLIVPPTANANQSKVFGD
ncbi:MAG TPA: PilN domain-containing protein [Candidatus Saccharimonadales bacterium]|nr:PilN domain-containing protein [Candidatus Saccharimonadales bacterium]